MFKRPGNLKGLTGFMKQTELYPFKCRSKSPTSSTFPFNRLSNLNVKLFRIFWGCGVCANNSKSTSYQHKFFYIIDEGPTKRRLVPIIANSCTLVFLCLWRVHVDLTKNNSCHRKLSYNLERNILK